MTTGVRSPDHLTRDRHSPDMSAAEIEVWLADFRAIDSIPRAWITVLSDDEARRLARIRLPADRLRYAGTRVALRQILAWRLKRRPSALAFFRSTSGKLRLVDQGWHGVTHFSLSHTGSFALIAVTDHCEVGVDIEQIRPSVQWARIAARYFPSAVREGLRLEGDDAVTLSTRLWCRLEALAKATGQGIVEQTVLPGWASVVSSSLGQGTYSCASDGGMQSIADLFAPPGYCAALAALAPELTFHLRPAPLSIGKST